LKKIYILLFKIIFLSLFSSGSVFADLQKDLINKLIITKTLSFDFKQKVAENEETGNCFIKYPLLMKCNYKNLKQKVLISNGKTIAIIKKKYKKIYYYPLKRTPLFIILKKDKIINLVKNNKPSKVNSNVIEFEFINEEEVKLKIIFEKNTLEFKGWKTVDAYSNNVSFEIYNLKTNNQIVDDFFKIPQESEL
jgi:outer membrane lipoprotein-sorting protein